MGASLDSTHYGRLLCLHLPYKHQGSHLSGVLTVLVALAWTDNRRGGAATFAGVCTVAAVFCIAEGHAEGAMARDLSLMCPEFIQTLLLVASREVQIHWMKKALLFLNV